MSYSCCNFEAAAGQNFDAARAKSDLDSYRKKGPGPTTRRLRDALVEQATCGASLLDIGCGIGALTFELLDRGVERAVAVDASPAYLAAASEEAARRKRAQAVQFVRADFLHVSSQLAQASIVTMDRVLCCFPAYEPLLNEAMQHAGSCLALSYPRDLRHIRALFWLDNFIRRVRGNPFRAFVHPVAKVEEVIAAAGFRLASRRRTFLWHVDVYLKSAANAAA